MSPKSETAYLIALFKHVFYELLSESNGVENIEDAFPENILYCCCLYMYIFQWVIFREMLIGVLIC